VLAPGVPRPESIRASRLIANLHRRTRGHRGVPEDRRGHRLSAARRWSRRGSDPSGCATEGARDTRERVTLSVHALCL